MATDIQLLDANARDYLRTYIDGKIQRYYLLFAVNGGAFAIAELMRGAAGVSQPLGGLSLQRLAYGAVIFTWLLWWDIWAWGSRPCPGVDQPCDRSRSCCRPLHVQAACGSIRQRGGERVHVRRDPLPSRLT
jgi:hypothetical protein